MKYLFVLLMGLFLGISGEFVLPKHLWVTVGAGCIYQKDGGQTFMPQLIIYDPKIDDVPSPYGGNSMTFVPSYRYAYALLSGELSVLNQNDCNILIQKFIDSRHK